MYVTQSEMITRFAEDELIQLTDRATPPAGVIDQTVLDMAIADANAEIDTYIKARYPQTLATVPAPLKRKAADIARYYLYDDMPTEHVKNEYDNAIAFLKQVAAGKISLGPDDSGNQPASSNSAEMVAPDRIFGRGDKGFL